MIESVAISLLLVALGVTLSTLISLNRRLRVASRIEAKIDLLIKHAGLNYNSYTGIPDGVKEALECGDKLEAIKQYRKVTGADLQEAKDAINELDGST